MFNPNKLQIYVFLPQSTLHILQNPHLQSLPTLSALLTTHPENFPALSFFSQQNVIPFIHITLSPDFRYPIFQAPSPPHEW